MMNTWPNCDEPGGGSATTVMTAMPLLPSLVAVMVAEPALPPVTRPLAFTVATAMLLLDQVMLRPVSVFPDASLVTAESCVVAPTNTLAVAGLTLTEATGTTDTVRLVVPLLPPLVAVMVAEPAATPDTSPLPFTVAMLVALEDQEMVRPVRMFPAESFNVAVSCNVPPTATAAGFGVRVTEKTDAVEGGVTTLR